MTLKRFFYYLKAKLRKAGDDEELNIRIEDECHASVIK